jgi:hypothetical protein
MYVVEIVLRNTAMPLSVQRKEAADAEQLYNTVTAAVQGAAPGAWLDLTCEQQTEKKLTILTSEVLAVQVYSKSGAASSGRSTGFAAGLAS